ncbi:hypothetical protein [Arenibaculum pallidiluteum]|uniref:hypothetical protein n=1 Tax=Arenibaculum pallidiluteum TaxID=2812559 RepID=UPI001A9589E2|nr:hypothetical protein [Arenibaculum pallidiluteum]
MRMRRTFLAMLLAVSGCAMQGPDLARQEGGSGLNELQAGTSRVQRQAHGAPSDPAR